MRQVDRIAFFEGMLATLLNAGKERSYVTFDRVGGHDEYVQYQVRQGRVYCEVGSREWKDPISPLTSEAVDRLHALGFSGGGPERNYARDDLPRSATELATLTDSLFRAAYGPNDEYAALVHLNLNDVNTPWAAPNKKDQQQPPTTTQLQRGSAGLEIWSAEHPQGLVADPQTMMLHAPSCTTLRSGPSMPLLICADGSGAENTICHWLGEQVKVPSPLVDSEGEPVSMFVSQPFEGAFQVCGKCQLDTAVSHG